MSIFNVFSCLSVGLCKYLTNKNEAYLIFSSKTVFNVEKRCFSSFQSDSDNIFLEHLPYIDFYINSLAMRFEAMQIDFTLHASHINVCNLLFMCLFFIFPQIHINIYSSGKIRRPFQRPF